MTDLRHGATEPSPSSGPMRILVAYAHPDDESFGPAAELALYARAGAEVYGLFATRGEHGETTLNPPPPPAELGRLRERDLRDAAALIGFRDLEILEYEDGTLDRLPAHELEGRVEAALRRLRPHVVVTFGPCAITRHPDHLAIHRATVAAVDRAAGQGMAVRELYYDAVSPERAARMGIADCPDGQPNTFIDVSATHLVKLQALRCHARHIKDAAERAARLEREPLLVALLHRAFPPVPPGRVVAGFLQAGD